LPEYRGCKKGKGKGWMVIEDGEGRKKKKKEKGGRFASTLLSPKTLLSNP